MLPAASSHQVDGLCTIRASVRGIAVAFYWIFLRLVRSSRGWHAALCIVNFLLWSLLPTNIWAAGALPQSVLIFDQSEPNSPFGLKFRAAIRSALAAIPAQPPVIYSEILELGRFNQPQYEEHLRNFLREKYRDRPIGVVIVHGSAAFDVFLRLRTDFWSSVPVVFALVDQQTIARSILPPDVTGTTFQLNIQNAVTAARALVPNLKRIAVVGTRFESDPFRRHFPEQFNSFVSNIEFIDLFDLPMAEIRSRIAALPSDAAIYYTSLYVDGAGTTFIPHDVVPLLAEVANRPIVSDVETHIGHGTTGGFVVSPETIGRDAARRVVRILDGEPAAGMPIVAGDFTKPVFDWRQLRRFGIAEAQLPAGSEVRFREFSLWEQYRWYIIALAAVLLAQATALAWMYLERRRRQAAQKALRERLLQVIHLNRTAVAGALSASVAHELNQPLGAIQSYAEAAELYLKADPPNIARVEQILANIRRDDQRAAEIIRHFRGLLKKRDAAELQEFDVNDVVRDTVSILDGEAMNRGLKLSARHAADFLPVRGDQVHLQQVILNLAVNGMDAMQNCAAGTGRMLIETALTGEAEVEVMVIDSGTGIPVDKLNEIFDTFYTTKRMGTGLGLSLARTIVETYGGKIWAENRPGGGAAFRFTLPLARSVPA